MMNLFHRTSEKKILSQYFSFLGISLIILLFLASSLGVCAVQEEVKKTIQMINPRPDFSFSLRLDKGIGSTYAPGEQVRISFRASKDSCVTLFGYDTVGNVRLLYPNLNQKNPFVEANREYYLDMEIEQGISPGMEYIQGFATTESVLLTQEIERRMEEGFLPIVEKDINRFIQRIRGILSELPLQKWVSGEILHYQVIERRPGSGQLRVESFPEEAEVYLNDRYVGKTPLEINQVRMGEYFVRVAKPGYEPWQKTIRVSDRKSTFLSADLESTGQFGSIAIRCNKDIARIYIDDQFKRLTQKDKDITIDKITAGYHDIRITLNGHSDWSQRVEIEPNQRIRLTAELFELEKNGNKGTLEIISNVDHALIYLNGDYQGRTLANGRITLSDLLEGSYEIKITKEGYDDYISNISIYPNHIKSLSVILQMQQEDKVPEVLEDGGSIAVYCNEDGARIFMNGNYIANTSSVKATLIEELREGRYEITVIKEGYQIWQEEVYVSAEEKISIFADIFKSKK